MSASYAKSAAPPYAILIWADELNIYAQLPSINGPYVAMFKRSEGGLSSALHQLGAMHVEHAEPHYTRPDLPPKVAPAKRGLAVSENDREAARDVLKKLGVI